MKNQIIKMVSVSFIFLCFFSTAYADTGIHLKISAPSGTIYDKDITVIPCNSDNNATTNLIATPYCAILQSGIQNDWTWFSFGALLNSLNNISGSTTKDSLGNDVFNFWDWSLNGTEAAVGLNAYTLKPGDIISLDFLDPGHTTSSAPAGEGPLLTYTAPAPAANTTDTSTPTTDITAPATLPVKPTFDIKKAYDFLATQQKDDGSWGSDLYTDWVALALASGSNQTQTIKLIKYFGELKIESLNLTDYERHAMALMALGLNPYNTNGENYIDKIITSFDGKQFGDAQEDNDDIFTLIVLQNAGYTQADKIITDDISFILGTQNENGSWDNSVDMTGAAMEALANFKDPLPASPLAGGGEIQNALTKAEDFLKQNQKDDGSWNNSASSTAWALEGILAMNEKPEDWKKDENTPFDYLAATQDTDGGVKNESMTNKIWETAYVASALSGKSWNQVMQNFEKPIAPIAPVAVEKVQVKNIPVPKVSMLKNPKPENVASKITNNPANKTGSQNTASVINAVTDSPTGATTEQPQKKNWFRRLLDSIFGN